MLFSILARTFSSIEKTASRLEMTDMLASLFHSTQKDEIDKVIYLTQGSIAPPHEGIDLGIGERFVLEAISLSSGYQKKDVEKEYKKKGDLGIVAHDLIGKRKQLSLASEPLTVEKVFSSFRKLASLSGKGSQEGKIKTLAELLNNATPLEATYIVRFPLSKMRLGVGDPTILDALSVYAVGDKGMREELERAYNLCSDLGEVGKTLFSSPEKLKKFTVILFKPIRPALAERLPTPEEIIEKLGKCAVEAKYDGLRMQVHRKGDKVEIFSRKQERITRMFPELVKAALELKADELIFEGEALAYDEKGKKYHPFQETMQRKRKYGIAAMAEELPLLLFAFDILYRDGKDCTLLPYHERRRELEKIIGDKGGIRLAHQITAEDSLTLSNFFNDCISKGLEGIIAKDLNAQYIAGARKFAWIKLKKSYGALADTIDCVIVGYYLGKGQRTEFMFGGLLAAVYNEDKGLFETIAKIGSGFSEDEMVELQQMLEKIKRKEKPKELISNIKPDFWTELRYVVSISADEITLSPLHTCGAAGGKGYALRFPRMVKLRSDKMPEDATTTEEISNMFRMQGRAGKAQKSL
jgi:DNA ligase-1